MSNSWMKKSWKRTLKLRIGHGYGMTPAFHEITCYLFRYRSDTEDKEDFTFGVRDNAIDFIRSLSCLYKNTCMVGWHGWCVNVFRRRIGFRRIGFSRLHHLIIPLLLSFRRPCRCIEFQERESVETYFVFFIAVHRNSNSLIIELENLSA